MKEVLTSSPRIPVRSAGYYFFANFTVVVDRLGSRPAARISPSASRS
jgi:hypothetical protein